MHPVPRGFTVASHDPAVLEGAVGGSGSSVTFTASGAGAGRLLRTSGMNWLAQSHWAGRLHVPNTPNGLPPPECSSPLVAHCGTDADGTVSDSDWAAAADGHPEAGPCKYTVTAGLGVIVSPSRDGALVASYSRLRPSEPPLLVHFEPSGLVPMRTDARRA